MVATYKCTRCAGLGHISAFNNVLGGTCFKCFGSGWQLNKPAPKQPKWGVMGIDRLTGERARLYNVRAKSEAAAIEKARNTMASASAAFKDMYSLENAIAVLASELDQQAA